MQLVALASASRDSGVFTPSKNVTLDPSAPDPAQNGQPISLPPTAGAGALPPGQPARGGSSIEVAVDAGTVPPSGGGSDHFGGSRAPNQNIRLGVGFSPDNADALVPIDRTQYNRPAWYMWAGQIDPNTGNELNPPQLGIHGEIAQGVGTPVGSQIAWNPTRNTFRLSPQPYDTFLPLTGAPAPTT